MRVAGQDPHALPPAERARVVALVSQENHVFAGTLRENLTLAAPSATDDAVWEALSAVSLAEWAGQLSGGLDTRVSQEGLGDLRRQLLALARVALLAPEVVVLDEPVSRAARGEAEILARAVAAVCRERTAITVIHHLDQAALCDRILVMERGAVVEDGAHEQLLHGGGRYAELWAASHADEHRAG
ncbi:ABC transporter ATP-binding protein [Kocuria sp. HSID17582]|nr:ABC transporter ATP-binding protein [Kocuria sp. HSID17582]